VKLFGHLDSTVKKKGCQDKFTTV